MTDMEQKDLNGENAVPQVPTENSPAAEPQEAPKAEPAEAAAPAPADPQPTAPEAPVVPETAAEPKPAEPAPYAAPAPGPAVPHLTLEPDFTAPEVPIPEPNIPGSAADQGSVTDPFQMPEPPHAPEPEPAYQQAPNYGAAPQYGNQSYGAPQYGAPQYQAPPTYGQSPQQPYYQPQYNTPPMGYVQKSRLAAGLLALMFGFLGIHNYYLGFNTKATIQLIVSLVGGMITCGVATVAMIIWGFIEGILLLSGNGAHLYDGNGVILRD